MTSETARPAITSTYRLQLRGDALTLIDARGLVDYLQKLGVSHLYLSPILTAAQGSTHGYDVTDPTTVSEALGGPQALRALAAELSSRSMGLVVDIVPNHLGVADPRQNRWWWDVLEHGRASAFANVFDIDWHDDNGAVGRIALPVLNSENDPIALAIDRSGPKPLLALHDQRFPLAPDTDTGNPLAVHDRQAYRLVNWRSGVSTYRRFFSVNSLAAVRQEDPLVFDATHGQVAAWAEHNVIDGIRVDHPDGLSDPAGYLTRLRELIGPHRWLLIEKILGDDEPLDETLPIDGTTGYDALRQLGGIFLDPAGEAVLTRLCDRVTGAPGDAAWLADAEHQLKRAVAQTTLAPDVRRLIAQIRRVTQPDVDAIALTTATVEVLASMPVYRSDYAPLAGLLGRTIDEVARRIPELADATSVLTQALISDRESFVRFNQVCGAMTAKSVEDALFYRTARLVSLQEVGGSPARFGCSLIEFHLANAERARRWPRAMTTLSTHDTKRGEDVRARIGVLSQVPDLWSRRVLEWEALTPSPDGQTGLFLLQNMFGVWPADGTPAADVPQLRERLHAYAEKAIREAGIATSWDQIDEPYEASVHEWIDGVIDGPVGESLSALTAQLAPHGWLDSLGQKLLQLCGPGIPDIYQGTELWEDSLVDPDNRRLVDFGVRGQLLGTLAAPPPIDSTGAAKLWLVAHALWVRRQRPNCFVGGSYTPMSAAGSAAHHLVGFSRGGQDGPPEVIALTSRHTVALAETGWADTAVDLPDGSWTDRMTGMVYTGRADCAKLFAQLPVALLVR